MFYKKKKGTSNKGTVEHEYSGSRCSGTIPTAGLHSDPLFFPYVNSITIAWIKRDRKSTEHGYSGGD